LYSIGRRPATVTIAIATSNAQLSTDASLLTFTPSTWNIAQTVYVRAVDDTVGEGAHTGTIRHGVTSADPTYHGMLPPPVAVRLADNDLPLQDASFGTPQLGAFGLANVGGGSATPVFVDIDGDADVDAFVGVTDGSTIFLRNAGTPTAPSFIIEVGNNFGLTDASFLDYAAHAFADIDSDGDQDAFIGSADGQTRFFRNNGSATAPAFSREAGPLDLVVANGGSARPTFADIDGDGDLDAFIGTYSGAQLTFFRNGGSLTAPSFVVEPGGLGIVNTQRFPSPRFVDLDGDGDQDLVSGADSNAARVIYRNVGTAQVPSFLLETINFGLTTIGQYTRPYFVDIDADGDLDAVAGNLGGDLAVIPNSAPGIQIRQSDAGTMVTEGGPTDSYSVQLRAAPTANVTLTLDTTNQQVGTGIGTLTFTPDNWNAPQSVAVAAVDDRLGEGQHTGAILHTVTSVDGAYNGMVVPPLQVAITDNDLPLVAPIFVAGDVNPFGITSQGAHSAPVLVDIDADGDLDAFLGTTGGTISFFLNIGTVTAPSQVLQSGTLGLPDVGDEASVAFADMDGDGDLDAFLGSLQGTTRYFRNEGTATLASFVEQAGNIGLQDVGASSRPAFADIDDDGDTDLFVGNSVGEVWFFRNAGNAAAPQFQMSAQASSNFGIGAVGAMASPALADLDGDGDLDAVVGDQDGQSNFYFNMGTRQTPSFAPAGNGPFSLADVGYAASPTFADIDGDGDQDALVGSLVGGTRIFLRQSELGLAPVADITVIDSARDDSFSAVPRTLNAVGADGAAVTYGVSNGTIAGSIASATSALGVLTVHQVTGAASFLPNDGAIEVLGAPTSIQVLVTVSDGITTSSRPVTINILQSGTTETTGNDNLGGTDAGDRLDGLTGNDSIDGFGGQDDVAGGTGFDSLLGGLGNDTLRGGENADTLLGGDGNDSLNGGKGTDSILGGLGNDTLIGALGTDLLNGGDGIDTADYSGSTDGVVVNLALTVAQQVSVATGLDTLVQIENLIGSNLTDTLSGDLGNNSLSGLQGNDTLVGLDGFDFLDGGDGQDNLNGGINADTLLGGIGHDFLSGGKGTDSLDGGEGNDSLSGGLGTDRLTGGTGVDRFTFRTVLDGTVNVDTITDFVSGVDLIELSASIFGVFGAQVGQTIGISLHLTYNSGTGVLAYDADGAGGNPTVAFAILGTSAHPASLGLDFAVVA
jgi:hypothetical protein